MKSGVIFREFVPVTYNNIKHSNDYGVGYPAMLTVLLKYDEFCYIALNKTTGYTKIAHIT